MHWRKRFSWSWRTVKTPTLTLSHAPGHDQRGTFVTFPDLVTDVSGTTESTESTEYTTTVAVQEAGTTTLSSLPIEDLRRLPISDVKYLFTDALKEIVKSINTLNGGESLTSNTSKQITLFFEKLCAVHDDAVTVQSVVGEDANTKKVSFSHEDLRLNEKYIHRNAYLEDLSHIPYYIRGAQALLVAIYPGAHGVKGTQKDILRNMCRIIKKHSRANSNLTSSELRHLFDHYDLPATLSLEEYKHLDTYFGELLKNYNNRRNIDLLQYMQYAFLISETLSGKNTKNENDVTEVQQKVRRLAGARSIVSNNENNVQYNPPLPIPGRLRAFFKAVSTHFRRTSDHTTKRLLPLRSIDRDSSNNFESPPTKAKDTMTDMELWKNLKQGMLSRKDIIAFKSRLLPILRMKMSSNTAAYQKNASILYLIKILDTDAPFVPAYRPWWNPFYRKSSNVRLHGVTANVTPASETTVNINQIIIQTNIFAEASITRATEKMKSIQAILSDVRAMEADEEYTKDIALYEKTLDTVNASMESAKADLETLQQMFDTFTFTKDDAESLADNVRAHLNKALLEYMSLLDSVTVLKKLISVEVNPELVSVDSVEDIKKKSIQPAKINY